MPANAAGDKHRAAPALLPRHCGSGAAESVDDAQMPVDDHDPQRMLACKTRIESYSGWAALRFALTSALTPLPAISISSV